MNSVEYNMNSQMIKKKISVFFVFVQIVQEITISNVSSSGQLKQFSCATTATIVFFKIIGNRLGKPKRYSFARDHRCDSNF